MHNLHGMTFPLLDFLYCLYTKLKVIHPIFSGASSHVPQEREYITCITYLCKMSNIHLLAHTVIGLLLAVYMCSLINTSSSKASVMIKHDQTVHMACGHMQCHCVLQHAYL